MGRSEVGASEWAGPEPSGELALLTLALDHIREAAFLIDQGASFLYVNQESCRILGYAREELLGLGVPDVDPDFPAKRWSGHWAELRERGALTFEGWHRTKDGRVFPVEVNANFIHFGGQDYDLALVRDISERKRAEIAMKDQFSTLSGIIDSIPALVYSVDRNYRYTSFNRNHAAMMKALYGAEIQRGGNLLGYMSVPEDREQARKNLDRALAGEVVVEESYPGEEIRSRDYFRVSHNPIRNEAGEVIGAVVLAQDLTKRQQAEAATHQAELNHLAFLEHLDQANRAMQGAGELDQMLGEVLQAVLAIFDCDRAFLLHPCDPDGETWGVPMERTRPEHPGAFQHGGPQPVTEEVAQIFRMMRETSGPVKLGPGCEHPLPPEVAERFGFKAYLSVTLRPKVGDPWIFGIHQCSREREWTANEERLFEEIGRRLADGLTSMLILQNLAANEAFIKNILESVDEGFLVIDRDFRIQAANRAYYDNFAKGKGATEVIGGACYSISHHVNQPCFQAGELCPVLRTFERGGSHSAIHVHVDTAGARQYIEVKSYPVQDASGRVVSAIETLIDITDKRRLEDQLRQSQKMEAIGQLAGGVAHDFNNILQAIIGFGTLAKMKAKPDDPNRTFVDQILSAANRAAHLTQGLLAFSRKQVIHPKPVDLNDIVASIEKLLRRVIGEDVELNAHLADRSLILMADTGQIEQVLMNLATNARDAMPSGGVLTLATEFQELGPDFVDAHGFGQIGRYALLTVSDTGVGMAEAIRDKIFEPFFTTKEAGKGTGLGLSIVYGIVKQHEGFINVYSEPGKGTVLKIYLPLVSLMAEAAAVTIAEPPRGRGELLLFAEDDADVRGLTTSILQDFGYRVLEAVDGEDALEKFKACTESIDLYLLDVIMPKLSGKGVADAVKELHPGAKILFISGYTADFIQRRGIFEEGIQMVSKPVSPFELLNKVRELLDQQA